MRTGLPGDAESWWNSQPPSLCAASKAARSISATASRIRCTMSSSGSQSRMSGGNKKVWRRSGQRKSWAMLRLALEADRESAQAAQLKPQPHRSRLSMSLRRRFQQQPLWRKIYAARQQRRSPSCVRRPYGLMDQRARRSSIVPRRCGPAWKRGPPGSIAWRKAPANRASIRAGQAARLPSKRMILDIDTSRGWRRQPVALATT